MQAGDWTATRVRVFLTRCRCTISFRYAGYQYYRLFSVYISCSYLQLSALFLSSLQHPSQVLHQAVLPFHVFCSVFESLSLPSLSPDMY